MKCKLPDNEYLKRLQRLDADSDKTNALIDKLLEMGTNSFLFSGCGEPFLHKNALESMGRVKHAGNICLANTNGTLLDNSTIDELIKIGFDELRITTMAGTREMYARTHPGVANKTFDHLKENLLYLAERKSVLGVRHPEVSLVYIVIAGNYDGLFDFAKLAGLVRADRVFFRPVDDIGDQGLSKVVPTKDQAAYTREQIIEVQAYIESKNIDHNINYFLKVFREKLDTKLIYDVIPCYYGWLSARIEVDGLVYPCCGCYEPLGNIHEKEFHEIWNGEAYRNFRKKTMQLNKRKKPVNGCDCNSCAHHTANLKAYKILHPVKGRSARLKRLCPALSDEGE